MNTDEIASTLKKITGVRKVKVEQEEDGTFFHVFLTLEASKTTVKQRINDAKTGLYNAGSYKELDRDRRVLRFYTP